MAGKEIHCSFLSFSRSFENLFLTLTDAVSKSNFSLSVAVERIEFSNNFLILPTHAAFSQARDAAFFYLVSSCELSVFDINNSLFTNYNLQL